MQVREVFCTPWYDKALRMAGAYNDPALRIPFGFDAMHRLFGGDIVLDVDKKRGPDKALSVSSEQSRCHAPKE